MLLISPIYAVLKPKSNQLKQFNRLITISFYLPISLVLLCGFIVTNLALLPLAYIYALVNKISLIKRQNLIARQRKAKITDLFTFLVTGIFYLIYYQFRDAFFFYRSLFTDFKKQSFESEIHYLDI